MNDPSFNLALLVCIVGAIAAGYVVQNTSLGSPVQVLTLAGVTYLIVKDLLASLGRGKRA